jgi:murein DD-endopeptidase MepM/ murein hydrolase activator NlpD
LYGHLSANSLSGLKVGMTFKAGQKLGKLGIFEENGGYAPHLHFQLIKNIGNWRGNYPGVCSVEDLNYYKENCPDPLEFLGYK